MNGLRYTTMVLLLSLSSAGQSRPYAKYNSSGEIIGLYNLSERAIGLSRPTVDDRIGTKSQI
jgi:hypothetical protein